MSTGAKPDAQWSDTDQEKDETFTGKPVDYTKASTMSPPQNAEDRKEVTTND